MSAPTPSWYDLLGVEPDASADEIRAAWKSSIADLDPSDRRFRTMNQAAEVLLDPDSAARVRRQRWCPTSPGEPDASGRARVEVTADGAQRDQSRPRARSSPPGSSPASAWWPPR